MTPTEHLALADALTATGARCKVLPLNSGDVPIRPGQQATVSACPLSKGDTLCVDRIYVAAPSSHWVVNDILIAGRSQITQKDLPGALFSSRGIGAGRVVTSFLFTGMDVVEFERDLTLIVTYVGPTPEGGRFFASAVGSTPPTTQHELRVVSAPLQGSATIVVRPDTTGIASGAFITEALHIKDNAADWMIGGIRINGKSQFAQAGAVPGDMFADGVDAMMAMDACPAGSAIEIDVIYIGASKVDQCFKATIDGRLVTRMDGRVVDIHRMHYELRAQIDTIAKGPRVSPELHQKILDFVTGEFAKKDEQACVSVELMYSPGNGWKDELAHDWIRANAPDKFDLAMKNIPDFVSKMLDIAVAAADAKPPGRHRFFVRTTQFLRGRQICSFALMHLGTGKDTNER